MKKRLLGAALLIQMFGAAASEKILGDWQGDIEFRGKTLPFVIHVSKDGEQLSATMDSPAQGLFGMQASEVSFANQQFQLVDAKKGMAYAGELKDGVLVGNFKQRGMSLPLSLIRKSDISGDWSGTLDLGKRKLTMVFHINQKDDDLQVTMDSPQQGAFGLPISNAKYEQGQVHFSDKKLGIKFEGKLKGDDLIGQIFQRGKSLPLSLTKAEKVAAKEDFRPQTPKGPFPYRSVDVSFDNKTAGVTLKGTLTIPKKVNAVAILISGSGPQNRDGEMAAHKPFLVWADYLSRHGIAVLRYDERGVGESTGNFATATSADLASDVNAAFEFLSDYPNFPHKNIGLIGHSEGGMIAPMVAAQNPDIAFAVMLAGPGIDGERIVVDQDILIGRAQGLDEMLLQKRAKIDKDIYRLIKNAPNHDAIKEQLLELTYKRVSIQSLPKEAVEYEAKRLARKLNKPWFQYFLNHDPLRPLSKMKQPVLALNGALDLQVEPEPNVKAIEKTLKESGHKDFTVEVLPKLNHMFQEAQTGDPAKYAQIKQTISPVVMARVNRWLQKRF